MNEEWRPIIGYEGYFDISSQGRVRRVRRFVVPVAGHSYWLPQKISRLTITPNGYFVVGLTRDGKCTIRLVHPLVLEAFVGPRPYRMDACHGNGVRTDNNLDNLRWATRKENEADKVKHGTRMRGIHHYSSLTRYSALLDRAADLRCFGISERKTAIWLGVSRTGLKNARRGESDMLALLGARRSA